MNADGARGLLAQARVLLLDFDGPVCSVFAGSPSDVVAEQLRTVLADGGHTELPDEVRTARDPFDVLHFAATLGDDEARYVEAAFTAHELDAITTAAPAPGAHELIRAWRASGRPLAIVSNNSAHAISAYLDFHDLRHLVNHVSGRTSHDPAQLKPSPFLLHQALTALSHQPQECVFIGDSVTDIEAGHAAGIPVIGYANKQGKRDRFADAGAEAITATLTEFETVP